MQDRSFFDILTSLYIPAFMLSLGLGIVSPVLPIYAKSFEVSYTVATLVISLAGVGRLAADLPAGYVADRVGRRPVVLAGPLLGAVGGLGAALAQDFLVLLSARFLMGVGMALWIVARTAMLADTIEFERRGRVMGLFMTSNLGGMAFGPAVGGFLADLWGIRAPFYFYSLVALLAFLAGYQLIEEPGKNPGHAVNEFSPRGLSRNDLLNSSFLSFAFANFCNHLRFVGRATLIPLFGGFALNLNLSQVGLLLAASTLLNLVLAPVSGSLMDRFGRKASLVPGLVVTGFSYTLFTLVSGFETAFYVAILMGIGAGLGAGTGATISADLSPSGRRGTFLALWNMIGDVATILGPLAMGILADIYGLKAPFLFVAAFMFLAAALVQAKGRITVEGHGAI